MGKIRKFIELNGGACLRAREGISQDGKCSKKAENKSCLKKQGINSWLHVSCTTLTFVKESGGQQTRFDHLPTSFPFAILCTGQNLDGKYPIGGIC